MANDFFAFIHYSLLLREGQWLGQGQGRCPSAPFVQLLDPFQSASQARCISLAGHRRWLPFSKWGRAVAAKIKAKTKYLSTNFSFFCRPLSLKAKSETSSLTHFCMFWLLFGCDWNNDFTGILWNKLYIINKHKKTIKSLGYVFTKHFPKQLIFSLIEIDKFLKIFVFFYIILNFLFYFSGKFQFKEYFYKIIISKERLNFF